MKVLSTLSSTPRSWQISATARISVNVMIGFVGVSMCTSFVCGRMARRTASSVGGVDVGELDAVVHDNLVEEARGATVDVLAADDVIARLEHRDHRHDRGHAAAEYVRARAAFKRCKIRFERIASWIRDPRVLVTFVLADLFLL